MTETFTSADGDAWHERNKHKSREPDPVMESIERNKLKPKSVLELGCGTGWRLENIREKYKSRIAGVEISKEAARGKDYIFSANAAQLDLMWMDGEFDLVIFGFMLYLVDRKDLFSIITAVDHVLDDGGHVIIHDFYSLKPYSRVYEHQPKLFSYKQDYAQFFLGNPAYSCIDQKFLGTLDDTTVVELLKKDMRNAYPLLD